MTNFREAKGKEADEIGAQLPPPLAKIGQRVWWNGIWGEVFTGRIKRIEIGHDRFQSHTWPCRNYVAQAESVTNATGVGTSWPVVKWESDTSRQAPENADAFLFKATEREALSKAVENLRDHAAELRRDAERFGANADRIEASLQEPIDP